jgi:hypothetical protein
MNYMKKIILVSLILSILFSCKKKTEEVIPPVATDPLQGEWYFRLVDADGANGNANHYGSRGAVLGQASRGNFIISTTTKILFQLTKVSDGKYSISINAYGGGQFLTYKTFTTGGYSYLPFSNNGFNVTNDELYTFEKIAGTTDSYLISRPSKSRF